MAPNLRHQSNGLDVQVESNPTVRIVATSAPSSDNAADATRADDNNQAGPSGLQPNQNNSSNAPESNDAKANETAGNDEAGPSSRSNDKAPNTANPPNAAPSTADPPNASGVSSAETTANAAGNVGIAGNAAKTPNAANAANGPANAENRPPFFIVSTGQERRSLRIVSTLYQQDFQNTPSSSSLFSYVTDRGMCSFGMPRRNVQENIIWIRAELRPADTLLERITVRNYADVTDVTLRHLALCAPNLRYLDVTGTSVTRNGIINFLKEKPDCQVISEFTDLDTDA